MARLRRLTSATDFERVRREGRSHAHPLLVLVAARQIPSDPPADLPTRIGFSANKRVGKAVVRNRVKRLLREAVRAEYARLAPNWDLILIARPPLATATLAEVQLTVKQVLSRARVVLAPNDRA